MPLIRLKPPTASSPVDNLMRLRYGKVTPPERGPFAVQKGRAGIPARVRTAAGSRPTAAGLRAPVLAPKPVTFFRLPATPIAAPPPSSPVTPPMRQVAPAITDEAALPSWPQALLGF